VSGAVPTVVSSLVIAGLVALFGIATLDAVRSSGRDGSSVALSTAPFDRFAEQGALESPDAIRALRDGGAIGKLIYTDAACRTVALHLPDLERTTFGDESACPIRLTGRGWRQVEDDSLLRRTVVREALGASRKISIREIARLGSKRLAAIVRDHRRRLDFLAVFEGGTLVARPSLADPGLSGVGVSPQRRHIAVRTASGGIYVLDRAGRFAIPGRYRFWLLDARAVAWSPDDKWTALAARSRLYLLETLPSALHVIDLPVSAIALDWR
jgi:hypothetical protein